MPGSVTNASASAVMPFGLCSAFTESREYLSRINTYRNGESQVAVPVATSRKAWALTYRLTPTEMTALRAFYVARGGATEAFVYYDPFAATPVGSNYDATGVEIVGRYVVRFDGDWSQSMNLGRGETGVSLIQLA